jgi:putative membrane protein
MRKYDERSIAKGTLAGMIGGLAGSWTMNQLQAIKQQVQQAWKNSNHRQQNTLQQPNQNQDEDDATIKTADRLVLLVTHQHLTTEQKKKAGPIVHYGYGALLGAIYGALAELSPVVTKGVGTVYASAVWLAGDEIAVPKLGLSAPPTEYPVSVHANALASHLVYGASLELVRRGFRAVF